MSIGHKVSHPNNVTSKTHGSIMTVTVFNTKICGDQ